MNQKFSISLFFGGLPTFLLTAGEILKLHKDWSEFVTPSGMGHLFILGSSFTAMLIGALGIQLPRKNSHNERVEDTPPPEGR